MDGDIDYSTFERPQLEEALTNIDRDRYPNNYQNLVRELSIRPAPANPSPSSNAGLSESKAGEDGMDMKSGNPALSAKTFDGLAASDNPMTLSGTINKTAMLLALVFAGAGWVWNIYFASHRVEDIVPYLLWGSIGGLLLAFATIFNKQAAPYTAPLYAVVEGLAIGGLSALYEARQPGIAIQAVGLTFGILVVMLAAYRLELIKVTEHFKAGLVGATGGIAILYLVDLVLVYFGHPVAMIHDGGVWGIAFSLFVIAIAALNLVMDFDFIEKGVEQRSPKYMEWYSAFGLVVTLVWLYLEILRLLGKRR
jgi:uncharacterized YccA/Bax inhibitor family protein